jgi:hypothetical protein
VSPTLADLPRLVVAMRDELQAVRADLAAVRARLEAEPAKPLPVARRRQLERLLPVALARFGPRVFTGPELLGSAATDAAMRAALAPLLAAGGGAGKRLGWLLKAGAGHPVGGLVLRQVGDRSPLAYLVEVSNTGGTRETDTAA